MYVQCIKRNVTATLNTTRAKCRYRFSSPAAAPVLEKLKTVENEIVCETIKRRNKAEQRYVFSLVLCHMQGKIACGRVNSCDGYQSLSTTDNIMLNLKSHRQQCTHCILHTFFVSSYYAEERFCSSCVMNACADSPKTDRHYCFTTSIGVTLATHSHSLWNDT